MKSDASSNKASTSKARSTAGSIKVSFSKFRKINAGKNSKNTANQLKRVDGWKLEERRNFKKLFLKFAKKDNFYYNENVKSLDGIVEKITNSFPQVSWLNEDNIAAYMMHYIRRIHHNKALHDEPIDKWAELSDAVSPPNKDLEQQLSSAIMVAAEEPIPNFSTRNGDLLGQKKISNGNNSNDSYSDIPEPDYNAVYKYIACAVSGTTLPKLSPIDALLVEDCMQSLAEQIKSLDDGDLRLNLRFVYLYLNRYNGQPPEEEDDEVMKQLSKGTLYNPLGLDENLIMPVPPK